MNKLFHEFFLFSVLLLINKCLKINCSSSLDSSGSENDLIDFPADRRQLFRSPHFLRISLPRVMFVGIVWILFLVKCLDRLQWKQPASSDLLANPIDRSFPSNVLY